MMSFIQNILKEKKMLIIYYSIGTFLYLLLLAVTFPALQSQSKAYNQLLASLPKVMLKAFGIASNGQLTFLNYLSGKYTGLILPLIIIFFIVSFSNSQLVGQIEDSTIGLILSLPISRIKIYVSKYISGIISIIIFIFFSIFLIIPLATIENLKYSILDIYLLIILTLFFSLSILSLSFFISSIFSTKSASNTLLSFIISIMYVFNIAPSLSSNLENLKYFSLFYYYNVNNILQYNNIKSLSIIIFSLIFIIFFLLGLFIFNRRDIQI